VSADRLAAEFKVNVVLMKEQMRVAEERGFVCRDDSYEGTLYHDNLFLKN